MKKHEYKARLEIQRKYSIRLLGQLSEMAKENADMRERIDYLEEKISGCKTGVLELQDLSVELHRLARETYETSLHLHKT